MGTTAHMGEFYNLIWAHHYQEHHQEQTGFVLVNKTNTADIIKPKLSTVIGEIRDKDLSGL